MPPLADALALRRLAARVLRPDLSRYADVAAWSKKALEDIAPHTPSASLWNALAEDGFIPRDWPKDRTRRFDSSLDRDLAWPPDIITAITLASDPKGVATVEVILRDGWRALVPSATATPVVRWQVVPRERIQPMRSRPGRERIVAALQATVAPSRLGAPARQRFSRLFGAARGMVEGMFGTLTASERNAPANERPSLPGIDASATFDAMAYEEVLGYDVTDATGDAFAHDLGCFAHWNIIRPGEPNPFAPLRRVWELGYAVDEVTADAVVVLAPEAPVPETAKWSRTVHVAGLSYEGRPALLHGLTAGAAVRLEREPDNPHDSHAIRVVTESGKKLGYVPRETAAMLGKHLDSGVRHRAELARVDPTSPSLERAVFVEITAE